MSTSLANPTLTMRGATLDDLEQAIPMFNACARAMSGRDEFSIEEYRSEWSDPTITLEEDTRVVLTPEGQLVGCMEVWNSAPHVFNWVWGRVHPDYVGQGIGSALLEWAEGRMRRALDKAPAGDRVTAMLATPTVNEAAKALFRAQGYVPVRHHYTMELALEGPPPTPIWAEGITVRSMESEDELEAVYRADDEAFRDHWGHVETPFEEGFAHWRHRFCTRPNYDPSLWFLAMDGEEIAGISLCEQTTVEDPTMGWVNILAVRRPWRRRGVGLALLHHSFGELYRRGQRRVGLGVDASSLTGATRLYERAGMHVARQYDSYEKELRPGIDRRTQSVE